MDDLDRALAKLAGAPAPAALNDMDARVLARIGARTNTYSAGLGIGAVTLVALVIGMAGAGVPATASAGASLGGVSPLAPSTLLATGQ